LLENCYNNNVRYDVVSLLDLTVKTIHVVLEKRNKKSWKDSFRGFDPNWELKDENDNLIGKYVYKDKKNPYDRLCNPDGSILLKFHIGWRGGEIRSSDGDLFGKISRKIGLRADTILMENSNGDKILSCKSSFNCPIWDKNENTVAEIKFKRFKNDWAINILESNFDRKTILGFSFGLFNFMHSGSEGGSNL